jgi:hypothetical protein
MNALRPKLDVDATRERHMALGCSHAAEQLDHMLSEAVRTEIPGIPSWTHCCKPNSRAARHGG